MNVEMNTWMAVITVDFLPQQQNSVALRAHLWFSFSLLVVVAALDSDDDSDLEDDHARDRLVNELLAVLSSGVDEECAICLDSLDNAAITRCAHVFCYRCIVDVLHTAGLDTRCPLCRAHVREEELIKVPEKKNTAPEKPVTAEGRSSAKVGAG